ncbi:MAG TPA: MFS transporter [Mycobacteriales bacterium]|nr:MFS transporter [Mycobacteriales bacterium]
MGRRRDYPGWRMVWALSITTTISYGVLLYAISVLLTPMRRDLHASLGALSGAISLSIAVAGILAPIVGAWLDRHGARALMSAGSVVAAVSVVGWSQARNLPELYLAFAGVGVASASLFYDSGFAVINTWFDRDRHAALLTLTVVAGFASTVFLPTTQALVDAIGWRDALLVLAALCGATAVPHSMLLRRHPADHGHAVDGKDGDALPTAPASHDGTQWLRLRDPELRGSLADPAVRWLTVSTVAVTAGVTMIIVYLVTYLRDRGYTPSAAAVGAGAIGVMSVSGRIAFTRLARRLRLARVAATMLVGQLVGIGMLAWLPRPWGLVVFVISFGSAFGVMTIARPALLGSYVAPHVFARVSGVQAMLTDVGRIAAPVSAGALIAWTGGFGAMLVAVTACSAVAAVALLRADAHDAGPPVAPPVAEVAA